MRLSGRDELRLKFLRKQVIGFRAANQSNLNHSNTSFNKGKSNGIFKRTLGFLRVRKKLWLAPIIIVMLILGGLLILAQGSVVAPFIYTLF